MNFGVVNSGKVILCQQPYVPWREILLGVAEPGLRGGATKGSVAWKGEGCQGVLQGRTAAERDMLFAEDAYIVLIADVAEGGGAVPFLVWCPKYR